MNKNIDFIVVGAQKSGTTSFYQYLKCHPEIFLPEQKELEFFYRDELFEKGCDWYLHEFFKESPVNKKNGDVSPQYMFDKSTPKRIKNCFPHVKIIILLRNPIDRAYSHYMMSCRRGLESRDFLDIVKDYVSKGESEHSDCIHDPSQSYIVFGEYGRIFEDYLRYFDRDNIMIIFSRELKSNAQDVMASVFDFLEVSDGFVSEKFEKTYHVGGGKRRFSYFYNWLKRRVKFRRVLRWLLTDRIYKKFRFWYETEFSVKKSGNLMMDEKARELLAQYYTNDVQLLERLGGVKTQWHEFTK